MKEFLVDLLSTMGLAVWIEIKTEIPRCTYYFGPFSNPDEAETAKHGYIQDLKDEQAQGIAVTIKRCKPTELTIADDLDSPSSSGSRIFSSQLS